MLFTRCPDCETTFRITADALRKANGQVRCGLCACVFNAHSELREQHIEAKDQAAESGALEAQERIEASAESTIGVPAEQRTAPAAVGVAEEPGHVAKAELAHVSAENAARPAAEEPAHGAAEEPAHVAAAGPAHVAAEEPAHGAAQEPAHGAAQARATAAPGAEAATSATREAAVRRPPVERERHDPRAEAAASFGDLTVADVLEQIAAGAVDDDSDASEAPRGAPKRTAAHDASMPSPKRRATADDASAGSAQHRAADRADARNVPHRAASGGAISDRHGEGVLESDETKSPQWHIVDVEAESSRARRVWRYGSVAAALILGLQFVHHFRAEVAGAAVIGPLVRDAYAMLGTEVVPNWDLSQYEIVDWVATAEPRADGQGSLIITARIRNKGPDALPYPHVQVQLKDRWEDSIGSRIFEPAEYLTEAVRTGRPMTAGGTASAKLEVVDPGPDAYGFELDVCVEGEAKTLRCSLDPVFSSR